MAISCISDSWKMNKNKELIWRSYERIGKEILVLQEKEKGEKKNIAICKSLVSFLHGIWQRKGKEFLQFFLQARKDQQELLKQLTFIIEGLLEPVLGSQYEKKVSSWKVHLFP